MVFHQLWPNNQKALGPTTSGVFIEVNNCLIWCSRAHKPFGSTFVPPLESCALEYFFINVFFSYSLFQNKLWGIVTSQQTFGLIFKCKVYYNSCSQMPQNSEFFLSFLFRKTDDCKIIHWYYSELKWIEQIPDWWIKYVCIKRS